MKRSICVVPLAVILLAASGVLAKAQAPASPNLWEKMDESAKFGYILGYSNASEYYQMVLRGVSSESGPRMKEVISSTLEGNPISHGTLEQWRTLVDTFYREPRNKGIGLVFAMQIAQLQMAKRPQSDIDAQIEQMREISKKP